MLAGLAGRASAQVDAPSDYLQITTDTIETFTDGATQIVNIPTPVTIETDRAKFTAKSAVVWFSRVEGSVLNRQRAEVALIGDARIEQGAISRSGERLFVSTVIGGPVRLTIENRRIVDPRQSELYVAGNDMRPVMITPSQRAQNVLIQRPWIEPQQTEQIARASVPSVTPKSPVSFTATDVQTTTATADGNIAAVLKGGVLLIQRRPNGDLIELQSQQAVLFTTFKDFNQLKTGGINSIQDAVTSAYLEGDARINYTPAQSLRGNTSEQRLEAQRVYYEFDTDRAVLTDVVIQSADPRIPLPVTMRANLVRQLSLGEYKADGVTLTTSQFATPSYSVNASKAYVRQYDKQDQYGTRTQFVAENATFRAGGVPVFYLPKTSGEVKEKGIPLRNLQFGGGRGFGVGVQTEWGLFESLGQAAPEGVDASYRLDYYSSRGPAVGFDAKYQGGYITETTREGWNFNGDLTAYLALDEGEDRLGRDRARIPQDDARGRIRWQHQSFFPDNWQLQLRAGYTSDATFLEEWFERDFDAGLPHNLSAYVKRQSDSEAITFLLEYQPGSSVTTADALQERFPGDNLFTTLDDKPFEIDRLPEVGYYRLGDSLSNDSLTFFSENRLGGYSMSEGSDTLADYGFRTAPASRINTPGIPSYGYTGVDDGYVIRGDFRQEIDYPMDAGEYRIVPYLLGRLTSYSDSPEGGAENRLLAGVGARITTAFWSIDNNAQSDFWDIHRVRHVVEPELNLFTSVSTTDREDVFIYDETIDGVSDISAISFMVRQRWQTKRGGPGRWRNVDFLGLNMGVIAFGSTPDEPVNPDRLALLGTPDEDRAGPIDASESRGLFFQSMPEASVPRSSFVADGLWRLSDTTVLLTDFSFNLDESTVSTAGVGVLVGRGDRLSYHAGLRYIGPLDSTIASFTSTYQLSAKYTINFNAAVDLAQTESRGGSLNVIRRSDRFFVAVGVYYDAVEDTSGLQFAIYPEGLAAGVSSTQLSQFAQ